MVRFVLTENYRDCPCPYNLHLCVAHPYPEACHSYHTAQHVCGMYISFCAVEEESLSILWFNYSIVRVLPLHDVIAIVELFLCLPHLISGVFRGSNGATALTLGLTMNFLDNFALFL